MAYRKVEKQSWGGRVVASVAGALAGGLLFLAAFPVLFWNEGNALHTAQSLEEGAKNVASVEADKVDPANEGKLVHVTAPAKTDEELKDDEFGVAAKAIRLKRTVEMYQYKEVEHTKTEKKLGGGTETVKEYTYEPVWSKDVIDSSKFNDPSYVGKNPDKKPFDDKTWEAKKVTAGAFDLSPALIGMINNDKPYEAAANGKAPPEGYKVEDNYFYSGEDPKAPEIGDVRVSYTVAEPDTVSLVAQQAGSSFVPYHATSGDKDVELLEVGQHDAAEMFANAQKANEAFTWIVRLVGFLMMAVGLFLVLKPLSVLGDVVPFFGNMIGAVLGLVAGLIALALSLITISIAWVFYRPLIGVPLLLVGVAVLAGCVYLARRRKAKAPAAGLARASARPSPV
jgi:transmembrane protein TMEM43